MPDGFGHKENRQRTLRRAMPGLIVRKDFRLMSVSHMLADNAPHLGAVFVVAHRNEVAMRSADLMPQNTALAMRST